MHRYDKSMINAMNILLASQHSRPLNVIYQYTKRQEQFFMPCEMYGTCQMTAHVGVWCDLRRSIIHHNIVILVVVKRPGTPFTNID